MKKIIIFIFIWFLFEINVYASNINFIWENTEVFVKVFDDISFYEDIPTVKVYKDNISYPVTLYKNAEGTSLSIVNTSKIGSYKVYYRAYVDELAKAESKAITFIVIDDLCPNIDIGDDIYVEYGSNYDLLDIKCSDNYELKEVIIDDTLFNPNKLGDYKVKYIAYDTSNNYSIKDVTIHLIDSSPPEIICNSYKKIDIYDYDYNFLEDCEVFDLYDGNLFYTLHYESNVDFNNFGIYDVTFNAYDTSNNKVSTLVKYEVLDRTSPIINLNNYSITLPLGSNIDYLSYIKDIADNYYELNINDLKIDSNYKDEVGRYMVKYEIEDGSGNIGESILYINIKDMISPIIEASNITLKLNDYFDPIKYVKAIDNIDGDITNRIMVIKNDVDTLKEGEYEVIYYVYDSSGNEVKENINVLVKDDKKIIFPNILNNKLDDEIEHISKEKEKKNNFKIFIIIGIIIFIFIVLMIKKGRKK